MLTGSVWTECNQIFPPSSRGGRLLRSRMRVPTPGGEHGEVTSGAGFGNRLLSREPRFFFVKTLEKTINEGLKGGFPSVTTFVEEFTRFVPP